MTLEQALLSDDVLEVGRKAVEDTLIDFRDSRISVFCGNGFVVKEKDGSPSDIIRLPIAAGINIALKAMLKAATEKL